MYLIEQIRAVSPIIDAVIGRKYNVPCLWDGEFSWPIIPLPHKDPEFNTDYWHCHFDFRFTTKSELSALAKNKSRHYNIIEILDNRILSISERTCLRKPGLELNNCRANHIHSLPVNNDEHNLACLKNGICPHKGHHFSKDSVKPDGVFECPLHGLKFKMSDGKMIKCKIKK